MSTRQITDKHVNITLNEEGTIWMRLVESDETIELTEKAAALIASTPEPGNTSKKTKQVAFATLGCTSDVRFEIHGEEVESSEALSLLAASIVAALSSYVESHE